jgi:hypothetical protein
MRRVLGLWTSLILLTGCGDRPPADEAPVDEPAVSSDIFAGLPILPGSRMAGASGNAAEAIVATPVAADSVARFYRRVLADRSWDIRGDATDPDGRVTLHARSPDGRPIWIIIRPTQGGHSEISVIATAVDSTASGR